jgi:drug/metabolite transporter (DMT)-like permease
MQQTPSRRGVLEMTIAMCMAGTIGLFVLESKQPLVNVVFFRCLIGALCLAVYCARARLFRQADFSRRNLVLLLIVGLSIVFNWLALFDAYRYTSIGIASTVYHVQPFFVFFLGALLFKEKLSGQRLFWLIIGFAGVWLIVNPNVTHVTESGDYVKGCGLALAAAMLYAVATLSSKKIKGVPPHVIALVQLLIGIVILGPFAQFQSLPHAPAQWGCLLVLGAVHSAAMYILLYSAYQKLDTSKIAILAYVYPVVAILVDYVYFGRVLSPTQIAGGVLVLSAGLCSTLNVRIRSALQLSPDRGGRPRLIQPK